MNVTKLGSYTIQYTNEKEFKGIRDEIFSSNIYHFPLTNSSPVIIDCGSHIGISILYFKSKFPNSLIYGYEPNPIAFKILGKNVSDNSLTNINLKMAAVDIKEGEKSFYIDTTEDLWLSTSGYINGSWKKVYNDEEFKVQTIDFNKELDSIISEHKRIDILKIDIEGYEVKLLSHISKYFSYINNLAIEYHPINKGGLDKVLAILRQNYNNIEFVEEGKYVKKPNPSKLVIIRCSR